MALLQELLIIKYLQWKLYCQSNRKSEAGKKGN